MKINLSPKVKPTVVLQRFVVLLIMTAICLYLTNNYEFGKGKPLEKKDKDKLISAPLGFITLRATRIPEGVRLSWMDKNVHEKETLTIERSFGGREFTSLGLVGDGYKESKLRTFTFTDSVQLSGEINYRLKKIDNQGEVLYSLPIRVDPVDLDFDFSPSANSQGDEVLVFVKKNSQSKVVNFAVWDVHGFLVFDKEHKLRPGKSDLVLRTGHLDSGVYFVTSSEGGREKTGARKFIIP